MSEIACPYCGRPNDIHSGVRSALNQPATGDLSLCWGCRRPSVFEGDGTDLHLRPPDPDEQQKIAADPQIHRALAVMALSSTPAEALNMTRRPGFPR